MTGTTGSVAQGDSVVQQAQMLKSTQVVQARCLPARQRSYELGARSLRGRLGRMQDLGRRNAVENFSNGPHAKAGNHRIVNMKIKNHAKI
jgi:hypothetical protein